MLAPGGEMRFEAYDPQGFYDEMFDSGRRAAARAQLLLETIESLSDGHLLRYKHAAERLLLQMGITFNVYGDGAGTERIFPFDLIPRIVPADEWDHIERGLKQRIHALNCFIDDIYHDQKILKDGAIPAEVITLGRLVPEAVPRPESAAGASGATSPARTWSATATAYTTCWKTTCACPPASPTCWRTARC